MKSFLAIVLLGLLFVQSAAGYVFYFSDEVDRASNINYALMNPYDGIDADDIADFDKYQCIALADQQDYARRNPYDNVDALNAQDISRKDFQKLRYSDQLRIINENPYDTWDSGILENRNNQQCWTLQDYNAFASQKPRDRFDEVRFQDFDDVETVQDIGSKRYHFFAPEDFVSFDLHRTRIRQPYYDPYGVRYSPYPRYGYGIAYGNGRYYD